jgi:hypothetical protein
MLVDSSVLAEDGPTGDAEGEVADAGAEAGVGRVP